MDILSLLIFPFKLIWAVVTFPFILIWNGSGLLIHLVWTPFALIGSITKGIVGTFMAFILFFIPHSSIEQSSSPSTSVPSLQTTAISSYSTPTTQSVSTSVPIASLTEDTLIPQVGDVVKQGGYELTVNEVETDNPKRINDDLRYSTDRMIYVDISIKSNAYKGVDVNPLYARLKDSDGFTYPAIISLEKDNLVSENDLAKGDNIRGWVSFKVSSLQDSYIFEYQPLSFGKKISLKVRLEPNRD